MGTETRAANQFCACQLPRSQCVCAISHDAAVLKDCGQDVEFNSKTKTINAITSLNIASLLQAALQTVDAPRAGTLTAHAPSSGADDSDD